MSLTPEQEDQIVHSFFPRIKDAFACGTWVEVDGLHMQMIEAFRQKIPYYLLIESINKLGMNVKFEYQDGGILRAKSSVIFCTKHPLCLVQTIHGS